MQLFVSLCLLLVYCTDCVKVLQFKMDLNQNQTSTTKSVNMVLKKEGAGKMKSKS